MVDEYRGALELGETLPPISLYCDGDRCLCPDGNHRLAAHWQAGKKTITAAIVKGTLRDATLAAYGANAAHGLRRSNTDKIRAVTTPLKDQKWSTWSDHRIAEVCAVCHMFVGKVRRELETFPIDAERTISGEVDPQLLPQWRRTL